MSSPRVLLTGATGFIGSHTWLALLAAGFRVVGVDNFRNSSPEVVNRIRTLAGSEPEFVQADVCDSKTLEAVFAGDDRAQPDYDSAWADFPKAQLP